MKKLSQILLGWWYMVTNQNNFIAQQRLKVCITCEHRKLGVCKLCGCVLQAKARLNEEDCPAGKWHYTMNWNKGL